MSLLHTLRFASRTARLGKVPQWSPQRVERLAQRRLGRLVRYAAQRSRSKVLVTNLANRVQPFIRYEVPDRVVLATEPCACGSRLPRIARIDGRSAEAFWIRDPAHGYRILPGVLFHNAIDALGVVREWRAVQIERNQIELQLEFLEAAETRFDAPAFIQRLRAIGLPEGVHIEVESVLGLLPDPQTGKFRRMASELGPPQMLAECCRAQVAR